MFLRTTILCSTIVLASPALAASDEDVAQKCVAGRTTVAPNGAQISFIPGGGLSGSLRRGAILIGIKGTWEVKNGVLNTDGVSDSGVRVSNAFPVRMDDAGNCFITTSDGEKRMEK